MKTGTAALFAFITTLAITMLAAVFARTTTLRAYTYVLKFSLHQPLLVAKRAATLAAISGDRFGLGVGQAVWPEEFAPVQMDFASRRPRMIEGIEIVRLALTGDWFEYHGKHYDQLDDCSGDGDEWTGRGQAGGNDRRHRSDEG